MNLTLEPDTVQWPEIHYVFIEKIGPFQTNAPLAWKKLHEFVPAIARHGTIERYFSLYKMKKQIYRAGVSVASEPVDLPAGLHYEKLQGRKYSRFVLTGPYSQLPEASGCVFNVVAEKGFLLRDDYNIENYVNDPKTTPEDQLITEIMFPMA